MDQRYSPQWAVVPVTFLVCLTVFGTVYYVTQAGIPFRNSSPNVTTDGKLTNSIMVNGDGKVFAMPDMVEMNVGVSELAGTTKDAQKKVNDKVQEIVTILKEQGVPDKDVQTMELSVYPEYDYGIARSLRGQRATQRLNIKLRGIDPKAEKVANLIDRVTQINGIEVNSITYDIEDRTKLYSQARELAFQKAKQKAEELARLGGVALLKPISITDAAVDYYPPVYAVRNTFAADAVKSEVAGGSQVPVGQLEVNVQVNVTWGIQ